MEMSRSKTFGTLKSICVPLLRSGTLPPSVASSGELTRLLEFLVPVLDENAALIDQSLADYVFIPLSHIFAQQEQFPARLLELSVFALDRLIQTGWKSSLSPDRFKQLLIFLINFLDSGGRPHNPEELQGQVLRALLDLLRAAHASPSTCFVLDDASVFPTLCHGVVLILDISTTHPSPIIQLHALDVLAAVFSSGLSRNTLAKFFPGVASSLARMLSPPSSRAQKATVLARALLVFQEATTTTLGDIQSHPVYTNEGTRDNLITDWLNTATRHLTVALTGITKLSTHAAESVQRGLYRLCISLLDECHHSLRSCTPTLTETALALHRTCQALESTNLEHLASIYPDVATECQSVIHAWMSRAPLVVAETAGKILWKQETRNLFLGLEFLQKLNHDTPAIAESFLVTLRDIVSLVLQVSNLEAATFNGGLFLGSESVCTSAASRGLDKPLSLPELSELSASLSELAGFLSDHLTPSHRGRYLASAFILLQNSDGMDKASSLWLTVEFLKMQHCLTKTDTSTSAFTSLAEEPDIPAHGILHELFDFSVDILNHTPLDKTVDGPTLWCVVIALDMVAFMSTLMRRSFRPELIDVLYPVTACLGSGNEMVQARSVAVLSTIAKSCAYRDLAELFVDNVDYMLNTVSLRLNALEISPITANVLVMMVRLSGPPLLPHLDDVFDAILGALEYFHGYSSIVSNMFAVLKEIVDQGASGSASSATLLEPSSAAPGRQILPMHASVADIQSHLDKRQKSRKDMPRLSLDDSISKPDSHHSQPWDSPVTHQAASRTENTENIEEDEAATALSPSYRLLFRITALTQHHLTSPAPQLRRSLLKLVSTVAPALATSEKDFLPILSELWPVILERLWDPEPYIAVEACGTLATLFQFAGWFLSSRLRAVWDEGLLEWLILTMQPDHAFSRQNKGDGKKDLRYTKLRTIWRSNEVSVGFSKTRVGGPCRYSQNWSKWMAAKKLMSVMLLHVPMSDKMLEDIYWLIAEDLRDDAEIKDVCRQRNGDVLWLVEFLIGRLEGPNQPGPAQGGPKFVNLLDIKNAV